MFSLTNISLVAGGGALGAVCRFLVSVAVQRSIAGSFPWHTTMINLIGCCCIGVVGGLVARGAVIGEPMRLFLVTGILGGFTTFSAFGLESVQLLNDGRHGLFLMNALLVPVVCVGAALLGWRIAA